MDPGHKARDDNDEFGFAAEILPRSERLWVCGGLLGGFAEAGERAYGRGYPADLRARSLRHPEDGEAALVDGQGSRPYPRVDPDPCAQRCGTACIELDDVIVTDACR